MLPSLFFSLLVVGCLSRLSWHFLEELTSGEQMLVTTKNKRPVTINCSDTNKSFSLPYLPNDAHLKCYWKIWQFFNRFHCTLAQIYMCVYISITCSILAITKDFQTAVTLNTALSSSALMAFALLWSWPSLQSYIPINFFCPSLLEKTIHEIFEGAIHPSKNRLPSFCLSKSFQIKSWNKVCWLYQDKMLWLH